MNSCYLAKKITDSLSLFSDWLFTKIKHFMQKQVKLMPFSDSLLFSYERLATVTWDQLFDGR